MKKLFLSFVAMASCFTAFAQQEPTDGGVYYLYNTKSGNFLSRGNNWGTRAVTIPVGTPWQVSVSEDGKYTLRMYDLVKDGSKSGLGDNCFTDNGSPVAFVPAGDANGYTLKLGDNFLTAPATAGDANYTPEASTWQFLNKEDYSAKMQEVAAKQNAAVAAAAGVELAGITLEEEVNNPDNWAFATTVDAVPTKSSWNVVGVPSRGGNQNEGGYGCEIYQGGGSFSKTISGLKPGIYKVKVKGLKRMTGNGTCYAFGKEEGYVISDAHFIANGNVVTIADWASACTSNSAPNSVDAAKAIWESGNGYVSEVYCYVGEDGLLNMQAKSEAYWGASWFLFGGVEYTYYTNEVSAEDAAALLATANEVLPQPMNKDAKEALETAVANGASTIKNYNALSVAVEAASASVEAYKHFSSEMAKANEILVDVLDNTNVISYEAMMHFSELSTAYNTGTLTTEEAKAFGGWSTAWHGANYVDDVILTPWSINGEQCKDYDKSLYINTWSVEANGKENGSGVTVPFFEYWVGDGESLNPATISATVPAEGSYYKVEALVRVRIKNNGGNDAQGITLQANDDLAVSVCNGATCDDGAPFRYAVYSVCAPAVDDNVTIKFNVAADNNVSWLSFKNVNYYEITEDEYKTWESYIATGKDELEKAISNALARIPSKNVGTEAFQYAAADVDNLKADIDYAAAVLEDVEVTADEVTAQVEKLAALPAPSVNMPAEETAYSIVMAKAGLDWSNNAVTITTGNIGQGGYAAAFSAAPGATPYTQAVHFQTVEGNKAYIYFVSEEGKTIYVTNGTNAGSTVGWAGDQIRFTDDAAKAIAVAIEPANVEGLVWMINTATGTHVGSTGNNGFYCSNDNYDLQVVPAAQNVVAKTVGDVRTGVVLTESLGDELPEAWNPQGKQYEVGLVFEEGKITIQNFAGKTGYDLVCVYDEDYDEYVTEEEVETGLEEQEYIYPMLCDVRVEEGALMIVIVDEETNPNTFFVTWNAEAVAKGQYTTSILPYAAAVPAGLTAYTVSYEEGNEYVTLEEVAAMAANTPYILTGEAGTYTFSGYANATAPAYSADLLTGVYAETKVPVGSYVLQTKEAGQKFYLVAEAAQPTLAAYKAYLTVTAAAEAKALAIGTAGEETAIKAVEALTNGKAEIFDLNGRRLQKLQKGLNIVNGVKIMVK